MELGFVATGKKPGRLQNDFHAQIFPGQIGGIALFENANFVTAHDNVLLVVANITVESPMHRIPLEKMCQSAGVGEIIDRTNFGDVVL